MGTGISARRLDQPFQAAGALLDLGQVERIQAYATAAGLELVEMCAEDGVSAAQPLARRAPVASG